MTLQFSKKDHIFFDIFVEATSKHQASGLAVPVVAVDGHQIAAVARRRAINCHGALLTLAHHIPVAHEC